MSAESKREAVPAEELLAEAGFLGRLARELVRGAERAEDLVQDTFVVALEHPPREPGALRGWLATVARNLARNARRGERRRDVREAAAARPEAVEAEALALERLELQKGLFELLLALPIEARTVLYLRYYEGLGPAAIAARLGVPVKTVKSRHTRALALLRERLDARTRGDRRAWVVALLPLARSSPAVPGGLSPVLGGLLMKKALVAAAAVVLLVLSWFAYGRLVAGARSHTTSERSVPLVTAPPPRARELSPELALAREPAASADSSSAARLESSGRAEVTLLWSDGTPARGIGAAMQRQRPRGAPEERVRATSDEAGVVRFEDLAPGTNRLSVDLRARFELEIAPGATLTTTVTLNPGEEVHGFVRAEDGRPVAAAALVFDARMGWAPEIVEVGRSEADGSFVLRDVEAWHELGARAPGFLPSPQVPIDDLPVEGGARRIEFRLASAGGRLTGRVLAPDGTPIAGARVLAGPRNGFIVVGPHGGNATSPEPRATRTDEQGRFTLEDALPSGPQTVRCVARGFGEWRGTATITTGTTELEIRLEPPARIEGRVVDVDGSPVAGAVVLQSEEYLGGWYRDDLFSPPRDVTDAEGRFVLEWVAPGLRELNAFHDDRRDLGRARAALECRAGETVGCELQLELGLTISGRVVDENGAPLAGWLVGSQPSNLMAQWYPRSTASDRDGRFRLVNLGAGAHDLDVRTPELSAPRLQVKAVSTGTEGLELVVPDANVAEGELVARLIDPAGGALDDVEVTLWRVGQNEGHFLELDPTTGMFRGRAFPGEYRLQLTRAGADLVAGEVFTLESGRVTDLGDLLLGARGRLELHVVGFPAEALASLHLRLVREGLRELELEVAGDTLRSPELLAGRWKVVTREREFVLSPDEFEVLSGGATRADLTVTPRRR